MNNFYGNFQRWLWERRYIYQGSWIGLTLVVNKLQHHISEKVLNILEYILNTYQNAYGANFYGNFHRQLWEWTFIKGSWIGLTLVAYNVTFMKTANIDFHKLISVKQITDFWMRILCMNFSRQVEWGANIEMGGRSLLLHGNRFWEIPSTACAYYCFNAGNRNGFIMQALARMGNLLMDDLNMQVVDEKRVN